MHKIIIPAISIIIGIIGLFLGIILGSFLGKVGSLEILAFILRIPAILISSPRNLKSKWRIWHELIATRGIERLKRVKEIDRLKNEIKGYKGQIKNIKAKIRRVKWEFREPKE